MSKRDQAKVEQAAAALAEANRKRMVAAAIRRAIGDGELTLAEAVTYPEVGFLTVYRLLRDQPKWGEMRARKACGAMAIPHSRRVRDLTERQLLELAEVSQMTSAELDTWDWAASKRRTIEAVGK